MYRLILLLILSPIIALAQNLKAEYKVTQPVFAKIDDAAEKKVASVSYTGHLYRKNGEYIYYQKPDYINEYPEGNIKITITNTHRKRRNLKGNYEG